MALENTESGLMTDEGYRPADFDEGRADLFDGDYDNTAAFNAVYEAEPVEQEQSKVNRWALRDRLRSKVLWASVLGCVMTVFSAFDIWSKIGITADGFREIAASVGAVLAAFGVFNDPTNREGF